MPEGGGDIVSESVVDGGRLSSLSCRVGERGMLAMGLGTDEAADGNAALDTGPFIRRERLPYWTPM